MDPEDRRAIEESARTDDGGRRQRPTHRNGLVRALLLLHPHWTDPPNDVEALRWRFCNADAELGIATSWGAVAELALSGITVRAPFDDARSKQARVAGNFRKQNAVERARGIDASLAICAPLTVTVLRLVYGPLKYDPRSPAWHPQVYAKLGSLAPVMPLVPSVVARFGDDYAAAGRWLLRKATRNELEGWDEDHDNHRGRHHGVREEAEALVFESVNRWRDVAGRRKRVEYVPDGGHDPEPGAR